MPNNDYIDSLIKILPAMQAKNMASLLAGLKETKGILTLEEYKKKLLELSTTINSISPKPSFKVIRGLVWRLISSYGHGLMLQATKDDISSLHKQIEELGDKVTDHNELLLKSLASNIENDLKDLENLAIQFEIANKTNREFSLISTNSFLSHNPKSLPRNRTEFSPFFFDNRTYEKKKVEELPSCLFSDNRQGLILNSLASSSITPVSVRLLTDGSSYATQVQASIENNINNLIDKLSSTFWTREVQLENRVDKVNTVLEFDLGGAKELNYLIVEPASSTPFFLEKVTAILPGGEQQILFSERTKIVGKQRVELPRILALSIRIVFSVSSYTTENYYSNGEELTWGFSPASTKVNVIDLKDNLDLITKNIISDKSAILPKDRVKEEVATYSYSLSLDNVWFGNSVYEDSGVFVSAPLTGTNFGICAVDVVEKNFAENDRTTTIEYDIIKSDKFPKQVETKLAIPHLGQTTVAGERLILIKKTVNKSQNDTGALRFCPYIAENLSLFSDPPVRVFKNGVEIFIGENTGFEVAVSLSSDGNGFEWLASWVSATIDLSDLKQYTFLPQQMLIRIKNPDFLAVYTANYTIRSSEFSLEDKDKENIVWLDAGKQSYLLNQGKVAFVPPNLNAKIDTDLYLHVTLRKNGVLSYSPILKQYTLLGSTYR